MIFLCFQVLRKSLKFCSNLRIQTCFRVAYTEHFFKKTKLCKENSDGQLSALMNSRLNMVVWYPTPFGLGRNGCWPSRGSQLPQTLPFIFLLCYPLNDRSRAAHSFFIIGHLFSLFLNSYPSLARPRLLILFLLLMSGNIHPNPGPIFPCPVCAGNVTWQGESVQCRTFPNGSI